LKNEADSLLYNFQKQLDEHKAKLQPPLVTELQNSMKTLKDIMNDKGVTIDKLREALKKFKDSAMKMGTEIYKNAKTEPPKNKK